MTVIYPYRCPQCDAVTTAARPVDQRDKAPYCAQCYTPEQPVRMRRIFSAPGLVFRGTGWAHKERR